MDLGLRVMRGRSKGVLLKVDSFVSLGRSRQNEFSLSDLDDIKISGRHAKVSRVDGGLRLEDLGSLNGTLVNGRPEVDKRLSEGDEISLGPNGPHFLVERLDAPSGMHGLEGASAAGGTLSLDLSGSTEKSIFLTQSEIGAVRAGTADRSLLRRFVDARKGPEKMNEILQDGRKQSRRMAGAAWAACAVSVVACLFLLIRTAGYKAKLKAQASLLSMMQDAQYRLEHTPGNVSESERDSMVSALRAYEIQFADLRERIKSVDRAGVHYADDLGYTIADVLRDFGTRYSIVPDIFIKQVRTHLEYFGTKGRLNRAYDRAGRLRGMIESKLAEARVPTSFYYLAMNESMLDPMSLSVKDARGIWQLMPATAKKYGLRVPESWKSLPAGEDERTDPIRSTEAAAKHLHELLQRWGDPVLVMASYNAGEPRVLSALRQIQDPVRDRDFWYLYKMGYLSPETNEYIPKIVALKILDMERMAGAYPRPGSR